MKAITKQNVIDAKKLLALGLKQMEVARLVGIGTGTCSDISNGKYDHLLEDKPQAKKCSNDEAQAYLEQIAVSNDAIALTISTATEMIRDGFKMLHIDIRNLIDTVEKYCKPDPPKYQIRDREQK